MPNMSKRQLVISLFDCQIINDLSFLVLLQFVHILEYIVMSLKNNNMCSTPYIITKDFNQIQAPRSCIMLV